MISGSGDVSVEAAQRMLDEGAVLLDVREPDEWAAGHAPAAVSLPMSQLAQRLDEVPTDRPVLAVCHVGGRSAQVAAALVARGYDVRNVSGGMSAWQRAGLPVVDEAGGAGRID